MVVGYIKIKDGMEYKIWHRSGMKKIIRKKRKGDSNQKAYSLVQDIIKVTETPPPSNDTKLPTAPQARPRR